MDKDDYKVRLLQLDSAIKRSSYLRDIGTLIFIGFIILTAVLFLNNNIEKELRYYLIGIDIILFIACLILNGLGTRQVINYKHEKEEIEKLLASKEAEERKYREEI
jgi:hypothetical protein